MPPIIEITTLTHTGKETSHVGNNKINVTMKGNKIRIHIPDEIGVKSIKQKPNITSEQLIKEDSLLTKRETGQDDVDKFYESLESGMSPEEKELSTKP